MESIPEIVSLGIITGAAFTVGAGALGAVGMRLMRAVSCFGLLGKGAVTAGMLTAESVGFAITGAGDGANTNADGGRLGVETSELFGGNAMAPTGPFAAGGNDGAGDESVDDGMVALADGGTSGGGGRGFDSGPGPSGGIGGAN